jgi:hypothetical protein
MEREIGRLIYGLSCDITVVFIIEGKHAAEQKVHNDSQTPEIDFLSIGLLEQNFGGNIGLYKLSGQAS